MFEMLSLWPQLSSTTLAGFRLQIASNISWFQCEMRENAHFLHKLQKYHWVRLVPVKERIKSSILTCIHAFVFCFFLTFVTKPTNSNKIDQFENGCANQPALTHNFTTLETKITSRIFWFSMQNQGKCSRVHHLQKNAVGTVGPAKEFMDICFLHKTTETA